MNSILDVNWNELLSDVRRARGDTCSHGIRWVSHCERCQELLDGTRIPSVEEMLEMY